MFQEHTLMAVVALELALAVVDVADVEFALPSS